MGLGYTILLETAQGRANGQQQMTLAFMPAEQGALYWPIDRENRVVLGDVMRPPLTPNSVARVLIMHLLEHSAKPEELLRVTWQILAPGGRLILVVPNRRGLWAHFGTTPFATGAPYSTTAIKHLLQETDFTLREVSGALFAPPSTQPFWLRVWPVLEWIGSVFLSRSGGVLIIEAEKQIYAAVGNRVMAPLSAPFWQGQTAPV